MKFSPIAKYKGERTGLVVMGMDYAGIVLENTENGLVLSQVECKKADRSGQETVNETLPLKGNEIYIYPACIVHTHNYQSCAER